jgi:ATP-dependent RNA helicase RhlE
MRTVVRKLSKSEQWDSPRGGSRSGGRSSGGSSSRSGGSRGGSFGAYSSGGSRRGAPSRGSSGRSRSKGTYIDPNKFINKATAPQEVAAYVSKNRFADFEVDERLKDNIIKKGYVTPTPIQDQAIPQVLSGRDVVGIANTGTGKTAAFLIPLIHKVLSQPKENVLILVPTRELAMQIDEELKGFTTGLRLYSTCVVGGAPIGKQIRDLKFRNEFVIGTPGRVKDLVDRKVLNLAHFSTVVLDEADRMLDMGFIGDMRLLMSMMPSKRHTLFFSATLSREIEALIGEFLDNPVSISVRTADTAKNVDQDIVRVGPGENKLDLLCEMLSQPHFSKVLVFGRTKHGVDKLTRALNAAGFKAESIHGDKNLSARVRALEKFKKDHAQVLVATDVAARGLDISSVTHVINFDLPGTYEDYVHRIGRTGRAGKAGKAYTFID